MKAVKAKGSDSGAIGAIQVTPSDTEVLTSSDNDSVRWVAVGTDGDLAVVFADGSEIVLPNLRAGVMYPLHIQSIKATGTTAGQIVAMF